MMQVLFHRTNAMLCVVARLLNGYGFGRGKLLGVLLEVRAIDRVPPGPVPADLARSNLDLSGVVNGPGRLSGETDRIR